MKEILTRAAGYLAKAQHMDGSWDAGDPFVCARAALALQAADGPELARDTGVSYLERLQEPDGRFPGKTGMYTDAACTAYVLVVLNRFSYSKASLPVSRGLLWLLERQNEDGSWSGRNATKNAYTTSICLRALHTYYLYGLAKYRRGAEHVLAYVSGEGFFAEPVSHVYAPVLNLQRIGLLPGTIRDAFVAFAAERADIAMKGGQTAEVAYLAGTLAALGEKGLYGQCSAWLAGVQNSDGGFGKDTKSESDPNWAALAVLALADRL
jgi:prenyltransferase beta subunit